MGRTDKLIIPIYQKWIKKYQNNPLAFFGATSKDKLATISSDFYDIQLKTKGNCYHWDMNDAEWNIQKKYKCIAFFRSSCFSKDPRRLLRQCRDALAPGGVLLIDWTMGSDHYSRDGSDAWTWGWKHGDHRCYGKYEKKRYEIFSSALTSRAVRTDAYADLCAHAKSTKKYKTIKNFEKQIESEFTQKHLLRDDDIKSYFVIEDEKNWSPLRKNGRAQLYTIQALRK